MSQGGGGSKGRHGGTEETWESWDTRGIIVSGETRKTGVQADREDRWMAEERQVRQWSGKGYVRHERQGHKGKNGFKGVNGIMFNQS